MHLVGPELPRTEPMSPFASRKDPVPWDWPFDWISLDPVTWYWILLTVLAIILFAQRVYIVALTHWRHSGIVEF